MSNSENILNDVRVLSAINGMELFGHERGNIEVFKILRDMGAEVIIGINALPDNNVALELSRLGFTTFALPFEAQWSIQRVVKNPIVAFTNIWALLRCSWLFYHAIRNFCPTHIHLGSPLVYSYLALALGVSKTPLIYRMGDAPPLDSPFNLRIWRMAMRRTTHLVSNSEFVRRMALNVGAKNATVIYNLAPTSTDVNRESMPLVDASRPLRLLYVGAVAEHKGLIPLVEAIAQLGHEYPSLRLEIVGGSRWDTFFRASLTSLISSLDIANRVTFHGHVAEPYKFYQIAALHVAPSIWQEPSANVVFEAKAAGIPSVVFPSGGLPELISHKVDGYICRENSKDALVEALRWMLADTARLRRMGDAASVDSSARFGLERFAREWAGVYCAKEGA